MRYNIKQKYKEHDFEDYRVSTWTLLNYRDKLSDFEEKEGRSRQLRGYAYPEDGDVYLNWTPYGVPCEYRPISKYRDIADYGCRIFINFITIEAKYLLNQIIKHNIVFLAEENGYVYAYIYLRVKTKSIFELYTFIDLVKTLEEQVKAKTNVCAA